VFISRNVWLIFILKSILFGLVTKMLVLYRKEKNKRPRIEPCGTPFFISSHLEDLLLSVTLPSVTFYIFLLDKI